jgi:hypothetical protein
LRSVSPWSSLFPVNKKQRLESLAVNATLALALLCLGFLAFFVFFRSQL